MHKLRYWACAIVPCSLCLAQAQPSFQGLGSATYASDVSPDGRTVVGVGSDGAGVGQAWIAFLGDVCPVDCDANGVLDIFDFLCFQNDFVSGDPRACDCSLTTGPAICDIFDFLCFQFEFVSGCP